mmetsp:Transcript_8506/g.20524  ORF Transcript_8506/g.20524 Transcript_8506/m.20524 type:complete len:443 (-) Transcript_8506:307-1635(-)|eukprot:CAMPEP_0178989820 /NCGR_PEP_ID=MMETSP0795-20121207/4590_1 /TAXON_ID=88552 /ORGANISM="Amoebophrya sp., Strain Ameob2" /LENGTH=442 /DNA_ID=CAMNT_0020681271 /DNA_START=26 /DNA_END=1354 /DNA_ORIENTATION=-
MRSAASSSVPDRASGSVFREQQLLVPPKLLATLKSSARARQFLIVLFSLLYFLAGGMVFSTLERGHELEKYKKNRFFYEQMKKLYNFEGCDKDPYFKDMDLCKNQDKFDLLLKEFFERSGNEMEDQRKWTGLWTTTSGGKTSAAAAEASAKTVDNVPSRTNWWERILSPREWGHGGDEGGVRGGSSSASNISFQFPGALFFVLTLVTSVGYGNVHPETHEGRWFTIAFGLIGIPLMCYLLASLGQGIIKTGATLLAAFGNRAGAAAPALETGAGRTTSQGADGPQRAAQQQNQLTRQILVTFRFFCVTAVLGALAYSCVLERGRAVTTTPPSADADLHPPEAASSSWTFVEALYFSACTLMTIGFGDYAPSNTASKVFTVFFILLGLGVTSTFIGLLTKRLEEIGAGEKQGEVGRADRGGGAVGRFDTVARHDAYGSLAASA